MSTGKNQIQVPRRTKIPVLLFAALALWGSTAFVYINCPAIMQDGKLNRINFAGMNLFGGVDLLIPVLVVLCLIGLVALVLFFRNSDWRRHLICAAIAIGAIIGLCAGVSMQNNQANILQLAEGKYTFRVEADQTTSSYNNSAVSEIIGSGDSSDTAGSGDSAKAAGYKVKLQFPTDTEEIHAGDIIQANVKFSSASDTQTSNYWQNGILANAKTSSITKLEDSSPIGWIYKFRNALIDTLRNLDANQGVDVSESSSYSQAEQLLNAIVCGQRIDLNNGDVYDAFRNCGLAHLVAVSGAHLSLVTAILLSLLKRLRVKKWLTIVLQSLFILAYLICAAVPISALRAAFMAYIAIFSFFSKRRPAPLNAIAICIIVLLAIDPTTSVSISFALSAGSTIGIIVFSRLFEYWIKRIINNCPEFITSALSLTFAASVCSQPLSVSIFNQLPLISPLANVVCAPLFSLICGAGLVVSIICTAISPIAETLAQFFYLPISWISNLMCEIVRLIATLPYACIPATMNSYIAIALTATLCLLLYKIWPEEEGMMTSLSFGKKRVQEISDHTPSTSLPGQFITVGAGSLKPGQSAEIYVPDFGESQNRNSIGKLLTKRNIIIAGCCGCVAIFTAIFIFIPKGANDEIVMLDVGQGDSILLKSAGKTFMIDTGNQDSLLKQRLAEQNVAHLDGLLITHPDDDHCGSIDVIQNMVQVDNFYCAHDLTTCTSSNAKKLMQNAKALTSNINALSVGDTVTFGNVEMEVIWPDKYSDEGGNADSLTVLANYDVNADAKTDATALLVGDAEKDQISEMYKKGRLGTVDIYKVGHHGSKNALYEEDAKKLDPKISIVSVGAKNRYGHPAKTTLDMLSSSQVFRTDTQGTITLKINENSIEVKTAK